MLTAHEPQWVRATTLAELRARACLPLALGGRTLALFAQGDAVYAVDNRCPHMGFPLHRGTVHDGILTCHWHHARFDLATGGTFDQFAGDIPTFPVDVRDGEVWVDVAAARDDSAYHLRRLAIGLELDIPLVLAKTVLALQHTPDGASNTLRDGVAFACRYRAAGWGQGATILSCMANLLEALDPAEHPRALYHGLSAVARDCFGRAPRFPLDPLPDATSDAALLKRWFRQFVEVRDAEGAERCLVTAVAAGLAPAAVADMLFAAATDHRYIQIGHVLDFTNKALEALDRTGWDDAGTVLGSLARAFADAARMEESNSWRHPDDLVAILEEVFLELPDALASGRPHRGTWNDEAALVPALLEDDPRAGCAALLEALRVGASEEGLAAAVAYAAALRIARFHLQNEFTDWDTALHTFTFAHAVHAGLQRAPSPELLRGVFDAAISVYLDRFLNIPAARLPVGDGTRAPAAILAGLPDLLNEQHAVKEAAQAVADYLAAGGEPEALIALLGALLLREDRDFHTIQAVEAAVAEFRPRRGTEAGAHLLIAAARYLAAHAPTMRAQGQTYEIALRFARGEALFEDD